ncbi:Fic family protein [Enterococcus faecium]|uniref:Fic family protein n=1 Tax=Enterococcus faecium TaxID=1352 RepID=UPI003CE52429
MYKDKYNLKIDESIFLAKKTLVENIYNQARLENINITFPDTKTIMEGMSVSGLSVDEFQKVINLRNAWNFIFDTMSDSLTIEYITNIHSIVTYGELPQSMVNTLRTGSVSIGGSFYVPKIPDKESVKNKLNSIFTRNTSLTEKALDYFLYSCRAQLFWDGNKRTSLICTNKFMIENGIGVLIIEEKHIRRFNKLMIQYYETADSSKIKRFLYDNCIIGIDYAN